MTMLDFDIYTHTPACLQTSSISQDDLHDICMNNAYSLKGSEKGYSLIWLIKGMS